MRAVATLLAATAAAQRYEVLEGVELVWAAPQTTPKGLVALFHATGRRAHHWWPASPKCPSCKALPAEARLARACLKHGLAAASLTAQTRTWQSDDGPRAAHALVALSTRQGWKVPLYAIGIGDGASFVATSLPRSLPPSLPLKGVHVQLFGDVPATRRPAAKRVAVLSMPRDAPTQRRVEGAIRTWRRAGAEVLEQRAAPLALDDTYFSRTLSGVSPQESRQLVRLLRVAGYVSGGGFLLADPSTSAWRGVVAAPLGRRGAAELGTLRVVARDDLSSRSSALGAALARAYGRSEASAEDADAALAFLLKE